MSNEPHALTATEWKEIGAIAEIRESWGAETAKEFAEMAPTSVYGVRLDFMESGPGYAGDLYMLQGDLADVDPPIVLIRKNGELKRFF